MRKNAIYLLLPLLLFWGCQQRKSQSADFTEIVYAPQYAKGFKIMGAKNAKSSILYVYNPWSGAEDVSMAYFLSRDGEAPPVDFQGVSIPADAQRLVCLSTTYIGYLEALDAVQRVVGVSGLNYVNNPYIQAHRDSVREVGYELSYETVLALRPDLLLLYGTTDARTAITEKLKELEIPYAYIAEYLESTALGKAEWLVAFAEFTGQREKGKQLFSKIRDSYNTLRDSLQAQCPPLEERPTVMLNAPYNDLWSMPSVQSYVVNLIEDAGGCYIYPQNQTPYSESIGMEQAFRLLSRAEFWLHPGMARSLKELLASNPKFRAVPAVKSGKVYNNNKRQNAAGGNDYWESAVCQPQRLLRDLHSIFYPTAANRTDSLYYYQAIR